MIEFLAELLAALFYWTGTEPYPDPDRDFGCIFLLGMLLLLAAGAGAIIALAK